MTMYVEGPLAGEVHRCLLGMGVTPPRRARPSSAPNAGRRHVRAPDPMPYHMPSWPHPPSAHRPKEALASGGSPRRQAINFSEPRHHGYVEYHASDATTHGGVLWNPSSSRPFGRPHSASSVRYGGHGGYGRRPPSDSSVSSRSRAGRFRPSTAGARSTRSARSDYSDETYLGYGDLGGGRYFDDSEAASDDFDRSASWSYACNWHGGAPFRRVHLHNMDNHHYYGTYDNSSISGSSMASYW